MAAGLSSISLNMRPIKTLKEFDVLIDVVEQWLLINHAN